jgi:hypothetical protein
LHGIILIWFFTIFSDEDGISMEWDNLDLQPPNHYTQKKPDDDEKSALLADPVLSASCTALPMYKSGKLLEVQNIDPVWCSQESGYLEWEGTTPGSDASASFTSASILSPLQEKRYEK